MSVAELAVDIAEAAALTDGFARLVARPEVRYLRERRDAGLLTAEEHARLAELHDLAGMLLQALAMTAAWAIDMRDADEARRPFLVRVIRRLRGEEV